MGGGGGVNNRSHGKAASIGRANNESSRFGPGLCQTFFLSKAIWANTPGASDTSKKKKKKKKKQTGTSAKQDFEDIDPRLKLHNHNTTVIRFLPERV